MRKLGNKIILLIKCIKVMWNECLYTMFSFFSPPTVSVIMWSATLQSTSSNSPWNCAACSNASYPETKSIWIRIRVPGFAAEEGLMAALMIGHEATRSGQRAHRAAFTLLTLLFMRLTCCVRCAEPSAKPSNIILILADDQDVLLGGMVSWSSRKKNKTKQKLTTSLDLKFWCNYFR